VIINSTGLVAQIRNEWVNMADEYEYTTKIVFIDIPIMKCYSRNSKRVEDKVPEEVIERMGNILQRPNISCIDKADKILIAED
jgi:predicted kinase